MARRTKITIEGWRPWADEKKSGVSINIDDLENPEEDFMLHLKSALRALEEHEMRKSLDYTLGNMMEYRGQMDVTKLYNCVGKAPGGFEISFPAVGKLEPEKKEKKEGTITLNIEDPKDGTF